MLVSLMAYEIFMPLFLLIPGIVWLPRVLSFDPRPRLSLTRDAWLRPFLAHFLLFSMINLAVVLIKMKIHGEHRLWQGELEEWIGAMSWLTRGVFKVTFLEQGLKLPVNVATLLRDHWRLEAVLIALTSFAAILSYLMALKPNCLKERRIWKTAALGGLGLLI